MYQNLLDRNFLLIHSHFVLSRCEVVPLEKIIKPQARRALLQPESLS